MAHVGILFCLYDHLKQLKEENIMAYMSEEGYKKLINKLKTVIADAKIIDESKLKTDSVQILNKVELKNVKNGMKMTYTIVSESEANLKEGKISVNTPIAQGLLGKKIGDVAEITVPQGKIALEVVNISI